MKPRRLATGGTSHRRNQKKSCEGPGESTARRDVKGAQSKASITADDDAANEDITNDSTEEAEDDDYDLPSEWHDLPYNIRSRVMEVVWARCSLNQPWWPALIYHPSGVTGDLKEQTIKCIATKHLVFFYGEESWGHVPFDTIKPFLENFDDLSVNPVQSMTKKKGKGKKMTERNQKHWSMGIISARKDAMKTNKWNRGAWIGLE